jgi:hypothetical protein
MTGSRTPPFAPIAGHDAALIGERAATRGRIAMGRGDERAGAKRALSVRAPAVASARGERRDQARTVVDVPPDGGWHPEWWLVAWHRWTLRSEPDWMSVSRPHLGRLSRPPRRAAHRRPRRSARARRDGGWR